MGAWGANFGANFAGVAVAVKPGATLEGNHARVFYGDARFDKPRTRVEELFTFNITGQIQVIQEYSLKSRISRSIQLPNIRSKISNVSQYVVKSKIQINNESILEGAIINKEQGKVYNTISDQLKDLKESQKHTRLKRSFKEYLDEFGD